ncbi:tudor domain-containing 6 [Xenentodon cancila]
MCSIPGLPTPGSEVAVLLTRVDLNPRRGLVELWVNLGDGQKHIYEKMREEIQTPQRRFSGSEGKLGDLCLVCISDSWHRARIVSTQSDSCCVFLIDQGQPHIATRDSLAWGPSESFLLPPETESCILANVLSLENEWPERVTKFLSCLSGKQFKGLVHHVLMPDRIILLEIPILTKYMCKLGAAKKVDVDKFKAHVQNYLHAVKGDSAEVFGLTQELNLDLSCQLDQYFYPELSTDTLEKVHVTEVTDPQNIFCKLLIFSKTMTLLSDQIHQHYEECSEFEEVQPQSCGDPCAARGKDGRWRRSLLKRNIVTSDGVVEVFHVDEGRAESVNVGHVRPLLGAFLRIPVVTYLCSMSGIKENCREWTADETGCLKSLLLNQTVTVKFDYYNKLQDFYHATLYATNGSCINDIFLERAGLCPSSQPVQDLNVNNEPASFPLSLGSKRFMDLHHRGIEAEGLLEKTWSESRVATGVTCEACTLGSIDNSEAPYPLLDGNGHLSAALPSEVQKAHHGDVFAVGKSVSVNVSCIEGLQKFWCQTTESADSLCHLTRDLQNHYATAYRQPVVDCVCVARNPDNGMWYRAKIIASHDSPLVDLRFIDCGQTGKVPLRDVHLLDPAFLKLNAQAFPCCLFSQRNPTNSSATTWTDAELTEFQRFVKTSVSSGIGLKCVIKGVTSDSDGLELKVVDVESGSESACKRLDQTRAEFQVQAQVPPPEPSDGYNYSTHNIEVGDKEKVLVTSLESFGHFYCQLCKNSHLLEKVQKNVAELVVQPRRSDPLGLSSVCLARYTDNEWRRAQIVETSPKPKVYFVDYGDTRVVNEADICSFPPEASNIRSVPVQAVPLGLFNVPAEMHQEVNQWLAGYAVGHIFTISVAAKGEKGKLFVELFDGSLNVNVFVRENASEVHKTSGFIQQTKQQVSKSPPETALTNEDGSKQDLKVLMKTGEQSKVKSTTGMSPSHNVSASKIKEVRIVDGAEKTTLDVILENKGSETCIEGSRLETTQLSSSQCTEGNVSDCTYTWLDISETRSAEVYASCIAGPHYFWCQYSNTTDLDMVSKLAREAGQTEEDAASAEMLEPGSPCLALFSSDNQWYRAQVIRKTDAALHVLFVDYGNESEIDIGNVKSMPQSLLKMAPQAFLCCLNGFNESKGSWDDNVYDDFYNVLVDKLHKVTVLDKEHDAETAVPQYKVKMERDNVVINDLMQNYWKPFSGECSGNGEAHAETLPHDIPAEDDRSLSRSSEENMGTCMSKRRDHFHNKTELVYASCIAEPCFFWCQFANTEDLNKVSQLAQEAGHVQQDEIFIQTLGPGSPCLALFSSDNQWYRARIIRTIKKTFQVLFLDYGNESEVDIGNVRPLPQNLLEVAPQAFLCRLKGFDESKGSWDDEAYDDFYSLLVDKLLNLTVFKVEEHPETGLPQYEVEVECEGVFVNAAMEKYWKAVDTDGVLAEHLDPS